MDHKKAKDISPHRFQYLKNRKHREIRKSVRLRDRQLDCLDSGKRSSSLLLRVVGLE